MNSWQDNPNKKAFALVRRSSAGQKDNTSADTQIREIINYCARNGLELVRTEPFIETAFKQSQRTKYYACIEEALQSNIKHIVFFASSRESRNLSDIEHNEKLVKEGRLIIHHVSEGKVYWEGTPDGEFTNREIVAVMNKNESRGNATKMKAAYKTKALAGWWPYRHTPLGYIHQKRRDEYGNGIKGTAQLVPDPDCRKVKLVQREFELRAEGLSYSDIRQKVIFEGLVPPSMLKSYSKQGLEKRLKNPLYRGYFYLCGESVRYEGKHQLIIAADVLRLVDASFGKSRVHKTKNPAAVFTDGWIRCAHPECQRQLTYDPKTKVIKSTGAVKTYHYFRCTNSRGIHSKLVNWTEEKLWEGFEPAVVALAITPEFAKDIADALNETQEKQKSAIKKQMAGFRLELEALRTERGNAVRLFASGKIIESDYNKFVKEIENREDHYVNELERLNISISDAGMISIKKVFELTINAKTLWKSMEHTERLEYLKKVCSNPVLDGLTVRFELKKPFARLASWKENQDWRRG